MAMRKQDLKVTLEGVNGAARGSNQTVALIAGDLRAIAIIGDTNMPATMSFTATEVETGLSIMTAAGNATKMYSPGFNMTKQSDGADITNGARYVRFPVYARIKIAVTGGNAGEVDFEIRWDDLRG